MTAKSVISHGGGAVALTFILMRMDKIIPGNKEQHAIIMFL
jgi:hypothetical protein